jgi:hypothetical protein
MYRAKLKTGFAGKVQYKLKQRSTGGVRTGQEDLCDKGPHVGGCERGKQMVSGGWDSACVRFAPRRGDGALAWL